MLAMIARGVPGSKLTYAPKRKNHPGSRPLPQAEERGPTFSTAVGMVAAKAALLAVITGADAPQALLAAARALIHEAQRIERTPYAKGHA